MFCGNFRTLSQLNSELALERGEDALHRLVRVRVGQGLVVRPERQREADGLLPLGDIRALVHVEDLDGLEVAAAGAADGIVCGVSTEEGAAFQGDEPITFNEAATVLNRVLAVEDVDLAVWYADREAAPSWAAQAVGNMEAVSVLAAGSFGSPVMEETVTRADAARMLCAASTLLEGEPEGLLDWIF